MAISVIIRNNTGSDVAITGLDNFEEWKNSSNPLSFSEGPAGDKTAINQETWFTKTDDKNPDKLLWRFVAPKHTVTKLFDWDVTSAGSDDASSAKAEFSLLWCIDDRCQADYKGPDWRDWVQNPYVDPVTKKSLPVLVIHSEVVPTGMPYFRAQLQATLTGHALVGKATIDRHVGTNGFDAKRGLMPHTDEEGKKYVPVTMNSFGLNVTSAFADNSIILTFETNDTFGRFAGLAQGLACPPLTACWRNAVDPAKATVALVREAPDSTGFARWDQFHGYTYAGAYQELDRSNQGNPDYFLCDANQNKTVKLTNGSGAFVHFDPPSPADGSAPPFLTPVDQIVWKDHLLRCESGGLMPR